MKKIIMIITFLIATFIYINGFLSSFRLGALIVLYSFISILSLAFMSTVFYATKDDIAMDSEMKEVLCKNFKITLLQVTYGLYIGGAFSTLLYLFW